LFLKDGSLGSAARSSADADGSARLELRRWRLDTESLVATACRLAGRELMEEESRTFVDPDGSPVPVCG